VATKNLADFHIHSNYSFDGTLSPSEIVKFGRGKGLTFLSITDHNNLEGVRDLWDNYRGDYNSPAIFCNGVNAVSGVEVTCRVGSVKNNEGNSSKIHLLVYGADINPLSPLSRLMDIKHENDRDVDFGILDYFLSLQPDHKVSEKDIRKFIQERSNGSSSSSNFSNNDIYNFLVMHGITVARSHRHFMELLESAPKISRVNIEASDLIKVAHASGGMVVLAHPALNLRRTPHPKALIQTLVDCEIDGFEVFYNECSEKINSMIKDVIRAKKPRNYIVYTGGSDTHSFFHGNTLGNYNSYDQITTSNQKKFINEIIALKMARMEGKLTHREYSKVSPVEIESIINRYSRFALETRKDIPRLASVPIMNKQTRVNKSPENFKSKGKDKKQSKKDSKKIKSNKGRKGKDIKSIQKNNMRGDESYLEHIRNMESQYSYNSSSPIDDFDDTNSPT